MFLLNVVKVELLSLSLFHLPFISLNLVGSNVSFKSTDSYCSIVLSITVRRLAGFRKLTSGMNSTWARFLSI